MLFLCRMKTVLPLKSKGGAEQGQGGGAVQDRLGEEGGRPSRAETEFGGWRERERGGLKTRLLIPQEVCKRHARVTPDPSQHTQRRLHTHTGIHTHSHTHTHKQHRLEPQEYGRGGRESRRKALKERAGAEELEGRRGGPESGAAAVSKQKKNKQQTNKRKNNNSKLLEWIISGSSAGWRASRGPHTSRLRWWHRWPGCTSCAGGGRAGPACL